jgi:uncharacterized protein YcbK (DUF882 family)
MKLSANFTFGEFTHSNVATRLGLMNDVPADLMPNLKLLARTMQRIRDLLEHPVVISSGYRCASLNRLGKGTVDSHHRLAAAADFICPGVGTPLEVCRAIVPYLDGFGIGQLIHEFGEWAHVGILRVAPGNRILTIDQQGVRAGLHPARPASGT